MEHYDDSSSSPSQIFKWTTCVRLLVVLILSMCWLQGLWMVLDQYNTFSRLQDSRPFLHPDSIRHFSFSYANEADPSGASGERNAGDEIGGWKKALSLNSPPLFLAMISMCLLSIAFVFTYLIVFILAEMTTEEVERTERYAKSVDWPLLPLFLFSPPLLVCTFQLLQLLLFQKKQERDFCG